VSLDLSVFVEHEDADRIVLGDTSVLQDDNCRVGGRLALEDRYDHSLI
jgi:hypothetical protein